MSNPLVDALAYVRQDFASGGIHTSPEVRMLMYSLCVGLRAKEVLELGFDQGYTTMALAASGAHVVGVDIAMTDLARTMVSGYPNCELVREEAEHFLVQAQDNFYDLVFVDDHHREDHVRSEAEMLRNKIKPGGIIVFHDVLFHSYIWTIIESVYSDWQKICLPCISLMLTDRDMGLGLVRRPL